MLFFQMFYIMYLSARVYFVVYNHYSALEPPDNLSCYLKVHIMENKTSAHGGLNLKHQIYQDLKKKLIHCVLPPGSELNELSLTEEYKVSRTPIREAISQLELEGYVKVVPKKGIYISDISVDSVVEIFQTRTEIEPLALRMAFPFLDIKTLLDFRQRFEEEREDELVPTSQLDMDMHLYIIDCCRNSYLIDMMHRLFDDNLRLVISTGLNSVQIHNARVEHIGILDSLITGQDPEASASLLKEHIFTCRTAALKYFSSEGYKNYRSRQS